MEQGTRANKTGVALEGYIRYILTSKGYTPIDKKRFKSGIILGQPIFTQHFPIGKSIYDTNLICDFILFHPTKHPKCLVIESKWQESKGSVDEKYPYIVENIKGQYPYETVVLLDGLGYKAGADKWLRSKKGGNLIEVFNMTEFQKWANSEKL